MKVQSLENKLLTLMKKAIYGYKMVEAGDKIMVGLSGGKDSLALLDLLYRLQKSLPVKYELMACHVVATDMDYEVDRAFLDDFCQSRGVPLYYEDIMVEYSVEQKKPVCFICSWKRRTALFDLRHKQGFNKLALGHHRDDAIATLLMNMVHHASISAIPPSLSMFGGDMHMIRPLILTPEDLIMEYTTAKGYTREKTVCSYYNQSDRDSVKLLISQMQNLNKDARINVFRAMQNIYPDYIVGPMEQ